MFYTLLRIILIVIFRVLFRLRVSGQENVPESGGVIIAPNHTSNIEPLLIGVAMPRRVTSMAKEELFSFFLLRIIIKALGVFPIKRGVGDRAAIRMALDFLRTGKALVVFPEGTRSKDGKLGKAQNGIGMMAIKSQVPIVPVALCGTFRFLRKGNLFPRFEVKFGKPILPPSDEHISKERMEEIGDKVMAEIASLQKAGV